MLTDTSAGTHDLGNVVGPPGTYSAGSGIDSVQLAAGTIAFSAIGAGTLFGNPGTASAAPSTIAVGSGLSLTPGGTLETAGSSGIAIQVGTSTVSSGTVTLAGGVSLASHTVTVTQMVTNTYTASASGISVPS